MRGRVMLVRNIAGYVFQIIETGQTLEPGEVVDVPEPAATHLVVAGLVAAVGDEPQAPQADDRPRRGRRPAAG